MTDSRGATPAVLLAGLLILGMPVTAANVENVEVPIDEVVFNPCTNEDVHLVGTAHRVTSVTVNGNTHHFIANANFNVDGIGLTSGDSYSINGGGMASENVTLENDEIGEANLIVRALLIGEGNVPNANVLVVTHITVNPNGDTTASFTQVHLICN